MIKIFDSGILDLSDERKTDEIKIGLMDDIISHIKPIISNKETDDNLKLNEEIKKAKNEVKTQKIEFKKLLEKNKSLKEKNECLFLLKKALDSKKISRNDAVILFNAIDISESTKIKNIKKSIEKTRYDLLMVEDKTGQRLLN